MTSRTAAAADAVPRAPWATASFSDTAETSPGELSALGAHVDRCNRIRGRWFSVQCAADSLIGFVAPRLVTTIVVVALVFGIASIVA